jgi:2-amino-4-hydroxy-6-hydroxymethyldihydropteridine diphosphokinase
MREGRPNNAASQCMASGYVVFQMRAVITLGAEDMVCMPNLVVIGFGANIAGRYGAPAASLRHSVSLIESAGLNLVAASGLYETVPVGGGRQPKYINAVAIFQCRLPPALLLMLLKRIEREGGRFRRGINGPRPLDLDIVAFGGSCLGWQKRGSRMATAIGMAAGHDFPPKHRSPRPRLVIPHPEMHRRAFVLAPLVEIAPAWHHQVLGCSVRTLLVRLPQVPGAVRRVLDSSWCS